MKYRIEQYKLKNGIEGLAIVFEDQKYKLLSTFLQCDVLPFEAKIKQIFDKVLLGQSDCEEVSGNVCFIEITDTITRIYDGLIEDDDQYNTSCCELNTKELRELIDEWCNKVREYEKNKFSS